MYGYRKKPPKEILIALQVHSSCQNHKMSLTPHNLQDKISACFDDNESQQQVRRWTSALSMAIKETIVSRIEHLSIMDDRVKVYKILFDVGRGTDRGSRDSGILMDLCEMFCAAIENEEGWGPDDNYVKYQKDKPLAIMKNAIASRIVECCENKKRHGYVRESAREYLDDMDPSIVKLLFDSACSASNNQIFLEKVDKVYDEMDDDCEDDLESMYSLTELCASL
jgi:hypothetical protein